MDIISSAEGGGRHTKEIRRYILDCCLIGTIGWVISSEILRARRNIEYSRDKIYMIR